MKKKIKELARKMDTDEKNVFKAIKGSEECLKSEIFEVKKFENPEKESVNFSPCTSDRGNLAADVDFSNIRNPFLDFEKLKIILKSYENHLASLKTSSSLGLAKFEWKGKRIFAYEKGKFKIRFAQDEKDALKTLNSVGKIILSSLICKKCSKPVIYCILGKCDCTFEDDELEKLEDNFHKPILKKSKEFLEEGFEKIEEIKENYSSKGKLSEENIEESKRKFRNSIEYAINFSLEVKENSDIKFGVILISLSLNNIKILEELSNLNTKLGKTKETEKITKKSLEFLKKEKNYFLKSEGEKPIAKEKKPKINIQKIATEEKIDKNELEELEKIFEN